MKHLIYYLECLAQFEDVRAQNRKAFQLLELQDSDLTQVMDSVEGRDQNPQEDEESLGDSAGSISRMVKQVSGVHTARSSCH
mmetsp:Transcript_38249/g.28181  ORF Transcript_38249/g.28181 Transcript_38249/m.28181 type:complete len:82 (-) Transcript_38249:9-254(-)